MFGLRKRIDFETHNGDEWKIITKEDRYITQFTIRLYIKRNKRKFWQKEYMFVDSVSRWSISDFEKYKNFKIDCYYEKEEERKKLDEFFKGV